LTNQNPVTIARGLVVYCVEDADNSWVDDHFQVICIITPYPSKKFTITNNDLAERLAKLQLHLQQGSKSVPYHFRANRGGRGHMRVGIKKAKQQKE
jgi:hypothetical protein